MAQAVAFMRVPRCLLAAVVELSLNAAAPLVHVRSLVSRAARDWIIATAKARGLRSSLHASRALDPALFLAALERPLLELDMDGDGIVTGMEALTLIQGVLNAPAMALSDTSAWLLAVGGATN